MRYINGGILCASIALFGCAHQQRAQVADSLQFCAADGSVQVTSTRRRGTDEWADKFRDRDVQRSVRDVIDRDPTLASQQLSVDVHQGEAIIGGTVEREADAVAAARKALAVPGVVAVDLQTTSRETPAHPQLVATLCE
jgi:osmotically-inducible protein OsmY